MSRFVVLIEGLDKLERKLRRDTIREPRKAMLREAAEIGQREASALAPRDTGALARDIQARVLTASARVTALGEKARIMEVGRRPGSKMPPPEVFERHGRSKQDAFAIARSIGRRGLKKRFFMRRARRKIDDNLPRLLTKMARDIDRELDK